MSRLGTNIALVAISILAFAPSAQAWQPIAGSRPVWSGASVTWELNSAGSDDLPFSTVETETRRGMEDWTRVSCSGLSTTYAGAVSTIPNGGDGRFTVGWIESGWGHSSSAIGVTGTRFSSTTIVEADMEMNGVNFTWITGSGSGSNVNLYSIALHEGGHFMGLGHSSDRGATMFYAYSGGIAALNADDETGICALYPGGGGGPTDCTTTGCPGGEECVDGTCVPIGGGGGEVCDPCTSSEQCGGPFGSLPDLPVGLGLLRHGLYREQRLRCRRAMPHPRRWDQTVRTVRVRLRELHRWTPRCRADASLTATAPERTAAMSAPANACPRAAAPASWARRVPRMGTARRIRVLRACVPRRVSGRAVRARRASIATVARPERAVRASASPVPRVREPTERGALCRPTAARFTASPGAARSRAIR